MGVGSQHAGFLQGSGSLGGWDDLPNTTITRFPAMRGQDQVPGWSRSETPEILQCLYSVSSGAKIRRTEISIDGIEK